MSFKVIVPDYGQHVVKIYSSDGTLLKDFGSFGVAAGQFRYPSAVCTDDQNRWRNDLMTSRANDAIFGAKSVTISCRIFVADECNNRISMFSSRGEYLGCPLTKDDGLTFPKSISLLSGNRIAVADEGKLVKVYSFVNWWQLGRKMIRAHHCLLLASKRSFKVLHLKNCFIVFTYIKSFSRENDCCFYFLVTLLCLRSNTDIVPYSND